MATTTTRPAPPAGYSYCHPSCYCRNCRRIEAEARTRQMEQSRQSELSTLTGDERLMDAMYAGTCARCRQRFPAGTRIAYSRQYRAARHIECTRPAGMLDCGHIVHNPSLVMRASTGTSCPDCYDRMS